MHLLALTFFVQVLEPVPAVVQAGDEVTVEVRATDGTALPGIAVRVQPPAGAPIELGETGAQGAVNFRPEQAGEYLLRAQIPRRQLVLAAPFRALPRPRRWVYILLCMPVGAVLLAWNLRRVIRRGLFRRAP